MNSFRQIAESAVGAKGRTGKADAVSHIEGSDLEKQFMKMVKELGGKTVARELLQRMNNVPSIPQALGEAKETPAQFLRDSGYKIKSENPTKRGSEIEFYKDKDAGYAKEELTTAGFVSKYSINVAGKFLEYIEL